MKKDKQTKWFLDLFKTRDVYELPDKVLEACLSGDTKIFDAYLKEYPDLERDTLSEFFQENFADRSFLSQDFTPDDVAMLMAMISGVTPDTPETLDECAGIGTLLIPQWTINPDITVYAREVSNATIPFLLFNLALRNMKGVVVHGDTLTYETFAIYRLVPGEKYSKIEKIDLQELISSLDPLMVMRVLNRYLGESKPLEMAS